MLALVDNLDSVSWEYMMTAEDNNGVETLKMTAEEASAYVGKDIKTCGESPKALQEMLTQQHFESMRNAARQDDGVQCTCMIRLCLLAR